jgi:GYF domain 2
MCKVEVIEMNKIWYIIFNGQVEGPYSIDDLKKDLRITPDTFVWKEGFDSWKRIKDVLELSPLFQDKDVETQESLADKEAASLQEELVLEWGEPPNFFWIFIALVIIAYFVGQLFWR